MTRAIDSETKHQYAYTFRNVIGKDVTVEHAGVVDLTLHDAELFRLSCTRPAMLCRVLGCAP
jgi:hypothetical protein